MTTSEEQHLENVPSSAQQEEIQAGRDFGGVQLFDENGGIRKIPIPSKNPKDPLNFSVRRQRLILIILCIYGTTAFGVVQSTQLYFGELISYYTKISRGHFDILRITELASYPSLCMGLGNFLVVPMSMALGRRSAFLFSNTLMLAAIIWAARSTSFNSHLGARCLQGLACGIADCLLPIIVIDISFLHQRSSRLSSYWAYTAIGSSLLLTVVPFAVRSTNSDWRANYWFWTAFAGFSLLLAIPILPDTYFDRPASTLKGHIRFVDAYGTANNFTSIEMASLDGFTVGRNSADPKANALVSKFGTIKPYTLLPKRLLKAINAFKDIFLCLLIPGALWTLCLNSLLFGGIVILSLYYSRKLETPPWNFDEAVVGTVQIGAAIGAIFSLVWVNLTAERLIEFQTRCNGGIRQPEFNLLNFIVPTISVFSSFVLYGVTAGAPEKHNWIGIYVSFALFYFGFCAISALTGSWLTELLPTWSGAAIILCSGGRNAISFGISYSFDHWVNNMGFERTHIMFGGLFLAVLALAVPLYFLNHHLRKITIIWIEKLG